MTAIGGYANPPALREPEGDGHPAVALVASALTGLVALAALVLVVVNRPEWTVWQWYFVVDVADAIVFGTVGYLLLSRSRHGVAWIVAATGLGGALAGLGAQWTELHAQRPDDVPELMQLQMLQNWAWVPGTMALFLVVPWLVRRGPLGPIARAATVVATALVAVLLLLRVTDPWPWPDDDPMMLLAIRHEHWVTVVDKGVPWAYFACAIGGLVTAVAVGRRWLLLRPDERRGFGWLTVAVALMSLSFLPLGLSDGQIDFLPAEFTPLTHLASQLFFPGALLVAVLGQRLWGVRLTVSRTLVWSLLTAALVVGYVGLVALSGLLLPDVENGVEQVAVTALLAAAIGPVRRFVQRRVDHLVYGDSIEPTRVIGRVGRSIGAGGGPRELLEGVLCDLVTALRLRGATIDVTALGSSELGTVTVFDTPSGDGFGAAFSDADDSVDVPLVLDHELVGHLRLWPRVGERIDAQTERSVSALTPLVAVAVRLAATAVELADSRARLASARDQERHALRRELHDGLGPALAGVGYGLRATRNLLASDPAAAGELIDRLAEELDARVADVRSLARELVPPVLLEHGLPAALTELADRQRMTGLAVALDIGSVPPLPPAVATTMYGVAVEALRNVVRHAGASRCEISLGEASPARLRLAISDDGVGVAPGATVGVGTQSMRERAESLGASLTVGPGPAGGTLVEMSLDLASEQVGSR